MTKLAPKRIHEVRTRGGNTKYRALRLDSGNFAWGSEHVTRKTRLLQVVRWILLELIGYGNFVSDILAIQRLQQRASPNPDPCQVMYC